MGIMRWVRERRCVKRNKNEEHRDGKKLKRDGWREHCTHINSDELICEMYTHNNIMHGRERRPTCVQKKYGRHRKKGEKMYKKRDASTYYYCYYYYYYYYITMCGHMPFNGVSTAARWIL
ncbi:hypothetical protein QTP88_011123 [Uroleucon formosanum]